MELTGEGAQPIPAEMVDHIATQRDDTLTSPSMANLDSPVTVTFVSLVSGRKPEYSERTHTGIGRTCKPQLIIERIML